MVLNKRGGNKSKKQKSSGSKTSGRTLRTKDNSPDSCELYGKVIKRCGGNPPQIMILCEDGVERNCVVRGKMTKRVWMNAGDYVIILYNKESSSKTGEIDYKYDVQEITKLEKIGEINTEKFRTENDIINAEDETFVFAEEEDEKNDEADFYGMNMSKYKGTAIANLDDDNSDDDEFNIENI